MYKIILWNRLHSKCAPDTKSGRKLSLFGSASLPSLPRSQGLHTAITKPEDHNQRLLLLRPNSLQSIPAFLRTPAGAPDTWKRSPDPEAARPTDPMPLPILCQLHFESLLHREVSCSLGERLSVVQTGKGPGRKKPQKWKEGFPESDRRRQGSGASSPCWVRGSAMVLLAGLSQRVHHGWSCVHIHCRSILPVPGFKTKYF